MTTKAMLQKEIDTLRKRVTELQNQLAAQTQTVSALQENEERLQSVLNNLLDAPYRRNLRTDCYDYLSPVIEQLTGRTVEEMNQAAIETVLSWMHPDDVPQIQQEIEQTNRLCQETGRATERLEYRFRTKAGDYRWVGDYLTVVAGEDGQPLYRLGVVRDISERKQAEEALWQSEQKYRQLFSEMSNGCALHEIIGDSDSGPVDYITLEVNHAYETFLNTKREAVIGKKASEILPPAELKKWLEIFGPVALTGKSTHYEMYSPLNQKYFEGSVYCPEKGKFAVTFTDITERKRAEAALRESEEKHRLISEMISDYLYAGLVYPDGKVETDWIIGPIQAITGYSEVELKTLPYGFASLVNPEDLAHVMAQQSKLLAGESMMVEYRFTTKSGQERWLRDYIRPLQDETHAPAIRLLGAVQDITERKQMEAERQAHLHFFASMDRVNRAIQEAHDLEQMMSDVLDVVLSIFDCDRAFLVTPCDPAAAAWWVPMERTKPEYPGVLAVGLKIPMTPPVAEMLRILLVSDGPVKFGPETPYPLPPDTLERFGFKSLLSMALYPKVGQPWHFGLHQCAYARIWTADEERLFQETGRRLADALTSLLQYRDLRDSERRLTEAQRIAHIGYWERDLEAGRIILSDEACRIFGLLPQDFPLNLEQWHQRWLALIHPEDRDRTAQAAAEALRDGPPYNVEYRIIRPNGEVRFIHSEAVVSRDESGRPRSMLGMMQDITEHKRAETALRESEERFRLFMDNSPTIAWIQDDQSRYVYLNQTYEKRFGARLESWRGKTIFEVWPVEVAQQLWQNDQEVLAADRLSEFTEEIPNPDGSLSTWWSFKFPFRNASGQWYSAGIGLDITERKAAEEALRISEARYRLIADHLNDIIWQLDQELRFVYTSPAVEHILGYSVEETNQLSITDLLDAEGLALMHQAISRKLDHPEEKIDTITEYKMRHKAGHMVEVEVVSAPIFDENGQCKGFTGVTRDIRERKHAKAAQIKLEEQLRQAQKMESIGRLAGGVAHDFNNLLTVILGYSELMQVRLSLEDRAREQLEQIRQSAKRAEGLTRQLLAFSRKQMLVPEVLDLNELVTNLRKLLERLIGEDIALITVLQPELWSIKADPGQLEQVIMNLAVNARDAMPAGGRLTIATANIPDASFPETLRGPGVRLTVSDTGCGVDEAIQAHIFEPFFTTKEKGKGTGLGLSTVYGIIKQSGGEITVDSQPGKGAAFSFYLPAHETVLTGSTAPQSEAVALPGRETILLVEDEKEVRNFVRVALRDYGYTLLQADHGYQALALAQQEKSIDLLLTDVVMPDINGRELAERVKALHPHLKVLFMSGYTDDEVLQRGVQMAEAEFIAKPFSPVVLAAKVRAILDR